MNAAIPAAMARRLMANMLTQTAQDMLFSLGIAESDVLQRCLQGLTAEASVVTATEAQWVVSRLAELAGWELPRWSALPPNEPA